jgi:sigma-E factor negative regulatory protein RseB
MRALSPALVLTLALLTAGASQAQTDARSARVDTADRSPAQWLQAIQTAAERLTYSGTIVMQRGGIVQSSRLIHVFDGGISQERLQVLDGRQREYLRRGADVDCLYPESRTLRRERRAEQEAFPAVGVGAPGEILMRYRLRVGGVERVAGVECRVLTLEPLDALRYGHWLCAERNTGLLLKAKTLDAEQRPMEQLAFTDLRIQHSFHFAQTKYAKLGWMKRHSPRSSTTLLTMRSNTPQKGGLFSFHGMRKRRLFSSRCVTMESVFQRKTCFGFLNDSTG